MCNSNGSGKPFKPKKKNTWLPHFGLGGNLRRNGHHFDNQGWQILLRLGPVAWFRWVFIDLDHHAANCRWAGFIKTLRRG